MKKLLAVLLALSLPASAGVQIIDGSAQPVFTDLATNGSLGALNVAATLTLRGQGKTYVQVVSVSGTQTLSWEGTVDNTNWFAVNGIVPTTGASVASTTAAGQWIVDTSGLVGFRVRCSAFTSGAASVFLNASLQASVTTGGAPLPTGANVIGALSANQSVNVAQIAGTNTVTGAAGVQAVSVRGNANASIDGAIAAAPPANALQVGIRAATANPTNATAGNAVAIMGDKAGRIVTTAGNVRELVGVQQTAVAATTETTIITAGGAGVFNDLSCLIVTTAGAAAQTITIKDATAGTTRFVINYPNAALAPGVPGTFCFPIPVPQAAANANWTVTQSAATATNYTAVFVKNQ